MRENLKKQSSPSSTLTTNEFMFLERKQEDADKEDVRSCN